MSDTPGEGMNNAPSPDNSPTTSTAQANTVEAERPQTTAHTMDKMPNARWETDKAPDLTNAFNQAAESEQVDDGRGQGPVSVVQQQWLIDERKTPAPTLDYTIGGDAQRQVDARIEQRREAMIKYMEERLQRVQGRARDSFNRER